MGLFDSLVSVGQGMAERAAKQQERIRNEYERSYSSAQRLSDDELKSRYKSIDRNNPTVGDYGVAKAAKERFSNK